MFAYCGNNPVNALDTSGEFLGAIIGAVVGAGFNAFVAWQSGKSGVEIAAAAAKGAISGAATGLVSDAILIFGASAVVAGVACVIASGVGNAVGTQVEYNINSEYLKNYQPESTPSFWKDFAVGAACSIPFAFTAGATTPMMEAVKQRAGKKALERGITVGYAISKTFWREAGNLVDSFGSEALQNFGTWLVESAGGYYISKIME